MRRSFRLLLVLVAIGSLPAPTCWFSDRDAYGGWLGRQLAATGRFRVEQVDGVWWLVTPEGHPFFSAGVTSVSAHGTYEPATSSYPYYQAILDKYGSEAAWTNATLERIAELGLDTIGAWSEVDRFRGRFPYTPILGFAATAPAIPGTDNPYGGPLRDFFDPAFESGAAAVAQQALPCAADPYCIGVFTDNELPWGPGFNQGVWHLEAFMHLPAGAPGKLGLQDFLANRYGDDIAAFDTAWRLSLTSFDEIQDLTALSTDPAHDTAEARADRVAFRGAVAERYFHTVHDALRAVAPDVLILGARFLAYSTGPDTAVAAAPWVDVLSVNAYEWNDTWFAIAQSSEQRYGHYYTASLLDDVDAMYADTGRPILIGEFGYRAADAGLPNSTPPVYPVLPDQTARADAYEHYMDLVLARPWVVGSHWFEYADQPVTGRPDGEDNNWGLVSITDAPYREVMLRMWSIHHAMYTRRAALAGP
jgi:hypothetical protein